MAWGGVNDDRIVIFEVNYFLNSITPATHFHCPFKIFFLNLTFIILQVLWLSFHYGKHLHVLFIKWKYKHIFSYKSTCIYINPSTDKLITMMLAWKVLHTVLYDRNSTPLFKLVHGQAVLFHLSWLVEIWLRVVLDPYSSRYICYPLLYLNCSLVQTLTCFKTK